MNKVPYQLFKTGDLVMLTSSALNQVWTRKYKFPADNIFEVIECCGINPITPEYNWNYLYNLRKYKNTRKNFRQYKRISQAWLTKLPDSYIGLDSKHILESLKITQI